MGVLATLGLAVVMTAAMGISGASAAPVGQCNGIGGGGGTAVECHVVIANTLDMATGATSSTVTLTTCLGAANDLPTLVCSSTGPTASTDLITVVDQCNGTGNGGGATLLCTVDVTNTITGVVTPTSVTVNQCNGSGDTGSSIICDPFPASTSGATITQCNGAANGGGSVVDCTIGAGSTETLGLIPVTVNQCNDSVNGGGSTVTCNSSITTAVVAPTPPPTTPPVTGGSGTGTGSESSSGTLAFTGTKAGPPMFLGALIVVAVGGLLVQAARSKSVGTK
jgi:hypothetical protein